MKFIPAAKVEREAKIAQAMLIIETGADTFLASMPSIDELFNEMNGLNKKVQQVEAEVKDILAH